MAKVQITDTILRDGHQSQAATRMRTDEMLPACEMLDKVGYYSLECWGGATYDACLRFLNEDPWERLRKLRKALPNTKLQMLLRGQNLLGYRPYADDVVDFFVKKAVENGIDIIRCFDALNDLRNMQTAVKATKKYGGTAEIAVISLGGIVASRSVRMAGDMFDQAIIAFIKRKYNLLIGERTAEQIKIEIGSAYALDPEMTMEIKGRNLVDGLPKNIVVHSEDVREALLECLVKITSAIKETLERTPPELSADIIDRGITLTGGGALLRGLDQLIQSETGIDVHIAEDPLDCVAKGAGAVLDHVDVLHDVLDTDGGHM